MMKKKFHYGIVIVTLSFLALFASLGIRGSFGTYITPWEREFFASRMSLSFISFLSLTVFAASIAVAGRLSDRCGPRKVLTASMLLMGGGLLLSIFASSLWQISILYGILASIGFGFASHVTVSVAVVRWFKEKRGFMLSLVLLGMAAGPMIYSPINIYLHDWIGWRWTFLLYGLIYVILFAPLYAVFYRDQPENEGGSSAPAGDDEKRGAECPKPQAAEQDGGESSYWAILRLPVTWMLVIPYFFCGFTDIGLIQTHLVPLLESREWSNAVIANAVLVFGLFNILGTACIGWLTDTVSVKKIIVFLFALRISGLIVLNFNSTSTGLMIFSVLYGLTDIASIAPFTMLCTKIFGAERMGTSFGLISFFHQFGAAAGSFIPGMLFQFSADYASTLWLSTGMLAVSALMIITVNEKAQVRPAGAKQTVRGKLGQR